MSILKKTAIHYLVIILLACSMVSLAQTPANREYQIKAVFLFNFTQFVEWPASAFSSAQAPMVIGILGKDPFGSYLTEIVSGEQVNGRPLIIQHFNNTEEIKSCHILFINLEQANLQDELLKLKGKNILTVSDSPNFLLQGGMIRFFTKNNKMQFQINLDATKEANLVISSKLLRLAEIFVSKKN